ncbi:ATG11 domain-containing protein [Psidium guajava]|nr:ATG11 domain-containing protein [Psidium guajava]
MSSSVTGGAVYGGKLLVHTAEDGHSFELDCDGDTAVETVMRYIESVSGINFNDQLVLCLDTKLEPKRSLSSFKLPSDGREVFIFNKARLHNNSLPPPPEQVDILEITDPATLSSSDDHHPLDDASDPALKALPSYERQFRYHYNCGNNIYRQTQAKKQICERLLREQKVQERALEVARSNLEQYYRVINQNYQEFMKRYLLQHRVHSDLLANFERDLERLRSIKLHPQLQTATRKCLLDFVKEDHLRKMAENFSNSHGQFENKVSQFKQMFLEMRRKVEDLFSSKASLSVRNLELMIKEHQRYINEEKSIMQSLSKDVNTVKKLVDDCLSCQLSSSLRPHDAVSALGPMYDVHDKNHLPKMQACDSSIHKLLELCKENKNEMNFFVHGYMQRITYISYFIKDIKYQFPVFKEAMTRQDDLFMDLKLVRGIGPAYRACLAEVVRRKASVKLYMGMAGHLAEKLAIKREAEVRRREEFLKAQISYLPKDVLVSMGLFDMPNQCDVNIVPFDTSLLDIDISDLDRYAPEYLAGGLSRGEKHGNMREKHGNMKGSFSMSNDSLNSAESFSAEFPQGSEDLPEGSELVEIAGTSKMEVENARLKAELASAIAMICSLQYEVEFESLDENSRDMLLKTATEKTAEALHQKDEYRKHLESVLREKQSQCSSYEKRIQELEQKLSDRYSLEQKLSTGKDAFEFENSACAKAEGCKLDRIGSGEVHMPCTSTADSMDEVSCISNSLNAKLGIFIRQSVKAREGVDENMMDSSGLLQTQLDSSMQDPHREELHVIGNDEKDKMLGPLGMSSTNSCAAESMLEPLNVLSCDAVAEASLNANERNDLILELQSALADKSNKMNETEARLKAALDEVVMLRRELEGRQKLLDESQMNCAHLENCLHEAREEAQTHLCAADRRASEYSALRASAVKMRSLFERLRTCVYVSGGVAAFAESLRALAQSLANTAIENEDDGTAEFRKCIRVLADRVGFLSRHREELLDKKSKIEAANEQLRTELEEKEEQVKTLYKKHQLEKQANKEKISFGRLEVHEIAAFVLNSAGHYEAINRHCLNYYLSAESVALFADHLPCRPSYIVGLIVHIERQTVKPLPSPHRPEHIWANPLDQLSDAETDRPALNVSGSTVNPYGLPVGCEYFVVTVAMLPDTAIHSPPTS